MSTCIVATVSGATGDERAVVPAALPAVSNVRRTASVPWLVTRKRTGPAPNSVGDTLSRPSTIEAVTLIAEAGRSSLTCVDSSPQPAATRARSSTPEAIGRAGMAAAEPTRAGVAAATV